MLVNEPACGPAQPYWANPQKKKNVNISNNFKQNIPVFKYYVSNVQKYVILY